MFKFSVFNFQFSIKRGFTLLETLVAISILSLALSGILSLFSIGVRASSGATNQIKAFFLASEGIEYIRNRRDSNIISGANWLSGLDGCASGCYVDTDPSMEGVFVCGTSCPVIKYDSTKNIYNYGASNKDTTFTRKITIGQITASEIKLTSEISWQHGANIRSFVLEERLFDLSF